ncbi:MAG: hypothetical protein QCH99_01675 [Candidatus Bathyarchaeota archaeon]|nr:hypothetical protein [Candidatus Bathyarchaeum tardum]
MKKILLIFILTLVIVSQVTFNSSFHTVLEHSHVSDTSAVIISKLNYATVRTTINIYLDYDSSPVFLIFPNGTQMEITDDYTLIVFLPKTGNFIGSYSTGTTLGVSQNSDEYLSMRLSKDNPIDIDVVPLPSSFLLWLDNDNPSPYFEYVDIFWFKIQGEAHVHINGCGIAL